MRKSDYLVKIFNKDADETLVHIRNIGVTDHASLCGMDGGLTGDEQATLPLRRGDKLNCPQCLVYYENRHLLNLDKRWIEKD
jgi:hypothetical protein